MPRVLIAGVWMLIVLWPVVFGLTQFGDVYAASLGRAITAWPFVWTTVCWSALVACITALLAIPAARVLAAGSLGWVAPVAAILAIPPWALFYAIWSLVPPGSWAHDQMLALAGPGALRAVILCPVLVAWMWPVLILCVLPASRRWDGACADAMTLDGASRWQLQWSRVRSEWPGLLVGMLVVFMLTAGCTTAFDLAAILTISNELRAQAAMGLSAASMMPLMWPLLAGSLVVAALLWWWSTPRPDASPQPPKASQLSLVLTGLIWCLLVAMPMVLLFTLFWRVVPGPAALGYGWAAWDALWQALIVGLLAALLCVLGRSIVWRGVWNIFGWTWLVVAMWPAPYLAILVSSAWRSAAPESMTTSIPWIAALLIRAGALAMLAARWRAGVRSRGMSDLRQLDGVPWWHIDPPTRAIACAIGLLAAAMSIADVAIAALLAPPMERPPLAVTLLNAIHYQRPDTVVGVLVWLPLLALPVGLAVWLVMRAPRAMVMIVMMVVCIGCKGESSDSAPYPPLPVAGQFGEPGRTPGRFETPRAIASGKDALYVIDKSPRVQAFIQSECVDWWEVPGDFTGAPVGVGAMPDGGIAVADTHGYRVAIFDADGTLQQTIGTYGMGPGEFVYPTDVIAGPDGWYVSEYGGNDRIQVFDELWQWQRSFGSPGAGPGAFARPQSLAFSPDQDILWIADAGNHRVQGVDPKRGEVVAILGEGELRHPWGVECLPDGTVLVVEFGAHRLSRWSPEGRCLGQWGGWGTGPGRLRMPWGLTLSEDGSMVWILDTGNARVVQFPTLRLGPPRTTGEQE